ncbi:hypothetical protein YC2023_071045 [Brassica napus]
MGLSLKGYYFLKSRKAGYCNKPTFAYSQEPPSSSNVPFCSLPFLQALLYHHSWSSYHIVLMSLNRERQSLKSQARHNEKEELWQIGVVSTSFRGPPSSPPQSSYGSNSLMVLSFDLMYTDLLETSSMTTSNLTQLDFDLR